MEHQRHEPIHLGSDRGGPVLLEMGAVPPIVARRHLTDISTWGIFSVYPFRVSAVCGMGAISLKLPDDLVKASGEYARALQLSRAEYIRRAIERMNRETRAQLRAERLAEASRRVRAESMRVNAEFAGIERDPDAE